MLRALPLDEFVAKVASTDEPVPAGGSVASLTGACAAALLALACGVLAKRNVSGSEALREKALGIQAELLALVDEDAAAYQAYLEARHDLAVIERVTGLPMRMAELCKQVDALGAQVRITGAVAGDVKAARTFAEAAQAAALQLAEANVALQPNAEAKANLKVEIERLRA